MPLEIFFIGALASGAVVCATIPLDTVKTRLTTQAVGEGLRYAGVAHCLRTVVKEEGVWALYRALPPRLLSTSATTGVQAIAYEQAKKRLLERKARAASAISAASEADAASARALAAEAEAALDAAFA